MAGGSVHAGLSDYPSPSPPKLVTSYLGSLPFHLMQGWIPTAAGFWGYGVTNYGRDVTTVKPAVAALSQTPSTLYDIVPSTTAIADYAIGLEKLSANEVFRWCSNGSKLRTDNSNYIRRFFYNWPRCLRQHKWNQNRLNRDGTSSSFFNFFFTRCVCVSCLRECLGARLLPPWSYGFHSLSTQTFRRALTASVDSYAEIKSAPSVA